jgi:glutathione peroxidase
MKRTSIFLAAALILFLFANLFAYTEESGEQKMNKNISDVIVKDIDGKDVKLSDYKGKILLIVNVASKCGNTPQYKGLQTIYEKYKSKGFEILAFPCNDFGSQEPGTNNEIKNFCSSNYNVTFKLFDKVKVLGEERSPLYERLINAVDDKWDVQWNFEKFLIDRDGNIISRFKNRIQPESDKITQAIETLLK